MVSSPILSSPDFEKHFYVQCDASNVGVGAVLFQKDENDGEHPIEYFSKKLNTAQRNYSTTEKECLAVVLAIEKFRQYIELMDFTVITDHSSLRWLMKQQDLNGRLARWSLKLQGFKFDIEHRKGIKNIVPDMLSRLEMDEIVLPTNEIVNLNSEEFKNPEYLNLIEIITQNKSQLPNLKVDGGIVYKCVKFNREDDNEGNNWRIWLPTGLTSEVIAKSHIDNTVHSGISKTLNKVRELFYWPAMVNQIKLHIDSCNDCKESKHSKQTLRPPIDAEALTKYVRSVENPLAIEVASEAQVKQQQLIHIIGEEVDKAYLAEVKKITINQALVNEMGKDLTLVYTPLHGTGKMLGEKALKAAGFEKCLLVPEQAVADSNFTTVKSPNPEEHSAFEYAIKLGEREAADLLIATDPDADRLGAAVRLPDSSYQVLTGNQLGAIMVQYILEAHQQTGTLPENAVVLKSIVSSELATAIAKNYRTKMIDVLTGFKFIAEKIEQYELDHTQTFMFGFEESYGYLIKPFVRDKDAIQALVLLAEVAAYYKKQRKTLYDALQEIFELYGYYEEKTISVTMSGIEGSEKIIALMKKVREESLTSFANKAVIKVEDFKTLTRTYVTGEVEQLETPAADVLKYYLEDGSWLAIRPSGTEPKIKFYLATKATSKEIATQNIKDFQQAIDQLVN